MKTNVVPDMYNKISTIADAIDKNPTKKNTEDDQGLLSRKPKKQEDNEKGKMDNEYSPAYKAAVYLRAIRNKRMELKNGNS